MIEYKEKPDKDKEIFDILNPLVKKWFKSKFKGFATPQQYALMEVHSRQNVLVSAPTGSGKTLTAFLSILNELIDSAEKGILEDKTYAIYISPLKALSNDISVNLITPLKEIEELAGKKLGIRVAVRTGDTTPYEKTKMLKNPPHILITTPESLAIVLSSIKFKEHLKNVEWCIIDEIHALAENKRGVHLNLSLERLSHLAKHMARVGLSATVAPLEEIAKFLVGPTRDCKIIDVQFIKEMDLKVLSPVPRLIDSSHEIIHQKMYELIDKLIHEHKTTLVFTNTRAATERVVHHLQDKFPKKYTEVSKTQSVFDDARKSMISDKIKEDKETKIFSKIGAHHGSLSKEHRTKIEENLRKGKLKAVVCSTSLELGIDIGYIDLVICLGSPKSVARALQRIGRSGHKIKEKTKGRIIVLDRDDLVECSVLLKEGIERKIDRIHIPQNCLDVLAQQIDGMALEQNWDENELFEVIKKSYCYQDLKLKDFNEILAYLAGEFVDLEDRYIYAKIWRKKGRVGRLGRMGRVIYMTNIGTIPDESSIMVKIGTQVIGTIEESFLEKLKPGDVFVLGGSVYMFKFARGTVAQVSASVSRPPTVPRWFSESLPLSFDLSLAIGKFRRLMDEKFTKKLTKEKIIKFIDEYLYVDKNGAEAIYDYFYEQYNYAKLPSDKKIVIEQYDNGKQIYYIFHTLFGRRVNDCLSRAVAFAVSKSQHKDVEIGISDNGFYITSQKKIMLMRSFKLIKSKDLHKLMEMAIDKTEVLNRRFRHCATRSLMILRNYKGRKKRVGRQQVSSMILMCAVKRINPNFSILKEAKREVLEDLMDIDNTKSILEKIEAKKIRVQEISTTVPSPFAFSLVAQGYTDIMKIEDKVEFLKRMHQNVLAKLSMKKDIDKEYIKEQVKEVDYNEIWEQQKNKKLSKKEEKQEELRMLMWNQEKVPRFAKEELVKLLDGEDNIRQDVIKAMDTYKKEIKKTWPKKLQDAVFTKLKNLK
jgi:ATP-dependent helicase Lhr and Lhr-like helicase